MNLKKIFDIYEVIKNRLPKTYPRPKLVFFEDEACMVSSHQMKEEHEYVRAIVDPNVSTISLPLKMTFEYGDKIIVKSITKVEEKYIAKIILHEINHLRSGIRYGWDSEQYSDEKCCDQFASRWYRIMKKEKLLS